jgi:hypothetical protein
MKTLLRQRYLLRLRKDVAVIAGSRIKMGLQPIDPDLLQVTCGRKSRFSTL